MQPINLMNYYCDKKIKKRLHVLKAYINNKKDIDLMHFRQDVIQMSIACVTVIKQYHINGLHLFWDTLYVVG